MNIVFATNNKDKVYEVSKLISGNIKLLSLKDINCATELPENGNTLNENAAEKARYVFEHYRFNCFADDSGLEVEALNGEPGVYSARYAGSANDPEANMDKLLKNLSGQSNRKAQFRTVICLLLDEKEYFFEGAINGTITDTKRGNKGFGYDPIFLPEGSDKTFAEMSVEEKNAMSHRAKAVNKLVNFLNKL